MARPRHLAILCLLLAWGPAACKSYDWNARLAQEIKIRLSPGVHPLSPASEKEPLVSLELVTDFYKAYGFQPVWVRDESLSSDTVELLEVIRQAGDDGLRPGDYHTDLIGNLISYFEKKESNAKKNLAELVDLELLLTDAFITFANHAANGRVDPKVINSDCLIKPEPLDAGKLLASAVEEHDVARTLKALFPDTPEYRALKAAYAHYLSLAVSDVWGTISQGSTLGEPGQDRRVTLLRDRLFVEGYLPQGSAESERPFLFDSALAAALSRFQEIRGIEPTGLLTPETVSELNIPARVIASRIALNLERWRWLPQDLGKRRVIVNIAGFELNAYSPETEPLHMKVIVGQEQRRTPMLSSRITGIILNPSWGVPRTIAREDMLPEARKDPGYFAQKGIRVLDAATLEEVNPEEVNWKEVDPENIPYYFHQGPGPGNPLGRLKFIFPNPFDVYLHDTPAGSLFRKDIRTFSSGCIRVEKPMSLAVFLLNRNGWTITKLDKTIKEAQDAGEERGILLPEPVPIHIVYWTAWTDREGTVRFSPDIYGRDEILERALREPIACTY